MSEHDMMVDEQKIHLTPTAVSELKRLITLEKQEGLCLRLGVTSGGCSGLSYAMGFDTEKHEDDRVFEFDGLNVLVDAETIQYINGATLDFKGDLEGGGFTFHNPNAHHGCSCGNSSRC